MILRNSSTEAQLQVYEQCSLLFRLSSCFLWLPTL